MVGFAVRMVLRNNIEQRIPRLKGQESHLQSHDDTVNDTVNDTTKPGITERQQEMLAKAEEEAVGRGNGIGTSTLGLTA